MALREGPTTNQILVVDDEVDLAETFRDLFEGLGFIVDVAHDGLQAMDKVAAQNYRLVLSDIRMPRCGGLQLAEFLKAHHPSVPVLLITGFADVTEDMAKSAGVKKLLSKPIDLEDLIQTVKSYCPEPSPPGL